MTAYLLGGISWFPVTPADSRHRHDFELLAGDRLFIARLHS